MGKIFRFFMVIVFLFSILGCSMDHETDANSISESSVSKLQEKLKILEKYKDMDRPLSMMLHKLSVEWPELYTQENEQNLLEKYRLITWHVSEGYEKEKLMNELDQHFEYQEIKQMYEQNLLPAQSVKVKMLNVSFEPEQNEYYDRYKVSASYELELKDQSVKEVEVHLHVDGNFEMFNERFLSFKDYGTFPDYPEAKEDQLVYDMLLELLSTNQILKLSEADLKRLFEFGSAH